MKRVACSLPGQGVAAPRQSGRQERSGPAPPRQLCTAGRGAVGGQLEGAGRRQRARAPAGEPRSSAAPSAARAASRAVGVLHRQLGQRRGPARGEGLVEGRHLAQQDAHRPAVADDVVQGAARWSPAVSDRLPASAVRRSRTARKSGPAEVERPRDLRGGQRSDAAFRAGSGRAERSISGSPAGSAGSTARSAGPAVPSRRRRWCAAPRGGARSRPGCGGGPRHRAAPRSRRAAGML